MLRLDLNDADGADRVLNHRLRIGISEGGDLRIDGLEGSPDALQGREDEESFLLIHHSTLRRIRPVVPESAHPPQNAAEGARTRFPADRGAHQPKLPTARRNASVEVTTPSPEPMTNVSGFQLVASLVGSLAWPAAVVIAVIVLRHPLASVFRRVRKVEALGVAAELAEIENAREDVQEELADPNALEVDELVRRAAVLGWLLGRTAPNIPPRIVVDRSGETPVVRSLTEDAVRQWSAQIGHGLISDEPASASARRWAYVTARHHRHEPEAPKEQTDQHDADE